VVDGNWVFAAGVTAGIDGALRLAAELRGEEAAQTIQLYMAYAPEPPFNSGTPETAPPAVLERARRCVQRHSEARGDRAPDSLKARYRNGRRIFTARRLLPVKFAKKEHPMSLEHVTAFTAAMQRKDLEAMLSHMAGDVVLNTPLMAEPVRGKDAIREVAGPLLALVDTFDFREIMQGPEHVFFVFQGRRHNRAGRYGLLAPR